MSSWLTDWLLNWLLNWLTDWLTDGLTDCLPDWLTDCLTDSLTDWLTNWLLNAPLQDAGHYPYPTLRATHNRDYTLRQQCIRVHLATVFTHIAPSANTRSNGWWPKSDHGRVEPIGTSRVDAFPTRYSIRIEYSGCCALRWCSVRHYSRSSRAFTGISWPNGIILFC